MPAGAAAASLPAQEPLPPLHTNMPITRAHECPVLTCRRADSGAPAQRACLVKVAALPQHLPRVRQHLALPLLVPLLLA